MFQSVFFTDRHQVSDLKKIIENLPKNSAVIFREYDLRICEREKMALKLLDIARLNRIKFFVGKDFHLAKKISADGVHFSDFDQIPFGLIKNSNLKLSYVCHSFRSFLKAQKIRPNMVFISPIFPTKTHQKTIFGTRSLGIKFLAKIIAKNPNNLAIYALGGVNSQNILSLKKLGLSGFGAINHFNKNI
jgi:thiamine-phosphate pyrophosphorylase